MARARRHHLISQAYQRLWSADGRRILQVTKLDGTCRLVGTRHAFVVPNLLTVNAATGPSDDAEEAFGRIESLVLPDVRRFVDGADDAEAKRGVVVLAAMHWARGHATTKLMRSIVSETLEQIGRGSETDRGLERAFHRTYGRRPQPGEREELARDLARDLIAANGHFVERILEAHNRAIDMWRGLHVQRVTPLRPSGPRFVFADAPVVVTDGMRGTADKPIPLGEASSLYFPLAPATAVFLTTKPLQDQRVPPWQVQLINQRTLMWASRFLGAHPETDVDRALGARPGTYTRVR